VQYGITVFVKKKKKVVVMASLKTIFFCLGCGRDITNQKGNRLIKTSSTRHILPRWPEFTNEGRISTFLGSPFFTSKMFLE